MTETVVSLFDKELAKYGGRFDLTNLSESARDILGDCLSMTSSKLLPETIISSINCDLDRRYRLYVDYVANWSNNAIAIYKQDVYLIGIWVGIPYLILNFFETIFRLPNLFPEVGKVDKNEWVNDLQYTSILNTSKRLRKDDHGFPMFFCDKPPKNNDRQIFGMMLGTTALQFIIQHELMHVYRGHLDFLYKKRGKKFLLEFAAPIKNGIPKRIKLAFEIDADVKSAYALGDYLLDRARIVKSFPQMFREEKGFIRIFTFIIGLVFHLLANFNKIPSGFSNGNHPNARIRAQVTINELIHYLVEKGDISQSSADQGRLEGIADLDIVSQAIIGSQHPLSRCNFSVEDISLEAKELFNTMEYFNSIVKKLDLSDFEDIN